ncbi:hypothetical protein BFP72_07625 [Reichenbachiella sp. 5M10]|nr:hypothetical protein BFP72_07625 [Reichenbachiella sp. 5M10]
MLAILSMVSVSYAQNQAPVFTSTPVVTVDDNVAYSYTAYTSDSDRDRVTVTATTKPSWLTLTNIDAEVTTFAGSGSSGSEDGHGTSASFNNPSGIAIDASGNIYVANANTIRKISPSGDVTTLAGSAVAGDTDGNGVNATFNLPKGLAIDAAGNVYVADTYSFKIRKISTSGDVTTLAGSGNVASIDGNGANASFNYPFALAVDATGNVYVADGGSQKIRKITPDGEVTTFAGSGDNENVDGNGLNASFISPRGLTIDAAGNLYVTSFYGHAVRKITPDRDVTTLAGSGTAGNTDDNGTSASFNEPAGIAVDGSGNLYVADNRNHKIRKISTDGDVTTLAGSGNPGSTDENGTSASFNNPIGVAVDAAGSVYVADQVNHKIRKISKYYELSGSATDQLGDHNVTLTASDGKGGTATQSFVLKVAKGRAIGTGNILYVDKNVSGGDERGSSWINAVPELADALVWAKDNYDDTWATTPLKIYVAKGTYKPLYSPEDGDNFGTDQGRNNSFSMVKNVQLYGGFDPANGIEDLTDTRILPSSDEAVGTILSGDIGTADDATDNTYNVLVSAGDVGTASLDGFSITDGYANDYSDIYVNGKQIFKCSGAGVYNSVSSPTYKHVTLHNNSCTESGGGMFSYMSSPALQLVILKNNQAKDGGGITNQESSSPTLLNVSIQSNNASENGSGMYNVDESEPTLTNVSIVGNEASVSSEEVPSCVSQNSSLTLNNCIIWDVVTGDYTAQNSLIKGTSDTSNGNLDATDLTDTDIFTDPANGDYSLKSTSIAVNSGSNTLYTDAGGDLANDVDIAGNARLYDGIPSTDIIDMGAYEYLDNIDPVFTSTTTASFIENETGTAYTVTATDANTITYSLGSGNDEALFDIVGSTGVVTFKAAPDFESPADADEDNAYLINVIASDGVNAANQNVTITVTDVDDTDPEFTSATAVNFAENETGTAYTVTATDANTVTYSLGSGNDEALFDIVSSTGVVTFKTAPDFESPADTDEDNAYVINVIASDGVNTVNQNVTITVTDVDDTDPVFTSVTAVNFAENETGTAYTVTATDANTVTYSLGSGNDEALFDIVGSTGVVTFKTAPDFENPADADEDNAYLINVIASDGVNTVNQNVTITVTDVDDTEPVFSSTTAVNFAENETGTAYTVTATDANTITYCLGSGNDESIFNIISTSGVVTFKAAPDFESPADTDEDNAYVINVIASDGVNTVNQNVTITVTDVDDTNPVFTSVTTASFIENETGTAYTVTATDANTITYSLGSGNDESIFNIISTSGVVTFKTAPDFESPADTDEDNDYVINVIASDGGNTVNQNVTITVTDVDDTDPVFTSATTASFIENETGTAYTVTATDANTITYSLGSGNDEALFDIVGSTGVVTFKTAPNFESPADTDADNDYVINVIASDGVNTVNQNVTITVTDVDDVITATDSYEHALNDISLYPNPTHDQLNIDLSNYQNSNLSVRITNVSGAQYFLRENIATQRLLVNVEKYPSGVYLVILQTANHMVTKRVIIAP